MARAEESEYSVEVRWTVLLTALSQRLWIGLVDVRPEPGNEIFDGAPGAYTNVLCLVNNEEEYCRVVEESFREMNLRVNEFEDIRPLEVESLDKAWTDLAMQPSEESPVVYDTFYIYESEEE